MQALRAIGTLLGLAVVGWLTWQGVGGWTNPGSEAPLPDDTGDEHPLQFSALVGARFSHYGSMGYPWKELREEIPRLKRDLPPDPGRPTGEDARKENERRVHDLTMEMPSGRVPWSEVLDALRKGMEPFGVNVTTAKPPVSDTFEIDLPAKTWTGFEILYAIHRSSEKQISYVVTSQGVCVGTDDAVNAGRRDADLVEIRRRLAAEHEDARLTAEFLPDLKDATLVGFSQVVKGQTGIEVVVDPALWELGRIVWWRAEPRPLREALDHLCGKMHVYWRYVDGRVWLLVP